MSYINGSQKIKGSDLRALARVEKKLEPSKKGDV
jgi:hypothetical protein